MSIFPPAAVSVTGTAYAGFGIRAVAAIIDILVLVVPVAVVTDLLVGPGGATDILRTLIGIGYYTAMTGGKWQATVGKRTMGIYVIRSSGEPVSYLLALGRYLASFISAIILGAGFLMAAFNRERACLHDLMCDTRVVYGKR